MTTTPQASSTRSLVGNEAVLGTIEHFTQLDKSGDKDSMNDLARRLGKEQPALLQYAAAVRGEHGDALGEAAVFYGTLMWAMFDRAHGKRTPQLVPDNITAAAEVIAKELETPGLGDKPVQERMAPSLVSRQPQLMEKLRELMAEDVKEKAITEEGAAVIMVPTQVIIEAFDAALTGKRPGKLLGPVVRDTPKVGRNDTCPCGSGKKYKRCHGLTD
jgi:hypothetical protein